MERHLPSPMSSEWVRRPQTGFTGPLSLGTSPCSLGTSLLTGHDPSARHRIPPDNVPRHSDQGPCLAAASLPLRALPEDTWPRLSSSLLLPPRCAANCAWSAGPRGAPSPDLCSSSAFRAAAPTLTAMASLPCPARFPFWLGCVLIDRSRHCPATALPRCGPVNSHFRCLCWALSREGTGQQALGLLSQLSQKEGGS